MYARHHRPRGRLRSPEQPACVCSKEPGCGKGAAAVPLGRAPAAAAPRPSAPCACASPVAGGPGTWHGVAAGVRPPHEAAVSAAVCRVQRGGRRSAAASDWANLDSEEVGRRDDQGPAPRNTKTGPSMTGMAAADETGHLTLAAQHRAHQSRRARRPRRRRSNVRLRPSRQQWLVSRGRGARMGRWDGPLRAHQRR